MSPRTTQRGITLSEIMIALAVSSVVIASVTGFFLSHQRAMVQEDLSAEIEANLRIGLEQLVGRFRLAGYNTPQVNLAAWIPTSWVSGFTANPRIVAGASATAPDTVSIARCADTPVATLTATADAGATALIVNTSAAFNTTHRRLISIGLRENAWVTAVGGATSLSIDIDPSATGLQGLRRRYHAGTPICRVDIETYSVNTSNHRLLLDRNDGNGPTILLDGVENLKVTGSGKTYQITLTARPRRPSQGLSNRVMSSAVTLRNWIP